MVTKKEFVARLAKEQGVTVAEATTITNNFLNLLADCIFEGGVKFIGFGSFKKVHKPAKKGVINGVEYSKEAYNTVKFSAGTSSQGHLNQ